MEILLTTQPDYMAEDFEEYLSTFRADVDWETIALHVGHREGKFKEDVLVELQDRHAKRQESYRGRLREFMHQKGALEMSEGKLLYEDGIYTNCYIWIPELEWSVRVHGITLDDEKLTVSTLLKQIYKPEASFGRLMKRPLSYLPDSAFNEAQIHTGVVLRLLRNHPVVGDLFSEWKAELVTALNRETFTVKPSDKAAQLLINHRKREVERRKSF